MVGDDAESGSAHAQKLKATEKAAQLLSGFCIRWPVTGLPERLLFFLCEKRALRSMAAPSMGCDFFHTGALQPHVSLSIRRSNAKRICNFVAKFGIHDSGGLTDTVCFQFSEIRTSAHPAYIFLEKLRFDPYLTQPYNPRCSGNPQLDFRNGSEGTRLVRLRPISNLRIDPEGAPNTA